LLGWPQNITHNLAVQAEHLSSTSTRGCATWQESRGVDSPSGGAGPAPPSSSPKSGASPRPHQGPSTSCSCCSPKKQLPSEKGTLKKPATHGASSPRLIKRLPSPSTVLQQSSWSAADPLPDIKNRISLLAHPPPPQTTGFQTPCRVLFGTFYYEASAGPMRRKGPMRRRLSFRSREAGLMTWDRRIRSQFAYCGCN